MKARWRFGQFIKSSNYFSKLIKFAKKDGYKIFNVKIVKEQNPNTKREKLYQFYQDLLSRNTKSSRCSRFTFKWSFTSMFFFFLNTNSYWNIILFQIDWLYLYLRVLFFNIIFLSDHLKIKFSFWELLLLSINIYPLIAVK